jgi:hypothetical protein
MKTKPYLVLLPPLILLSGAFAWYAGIPSGSSRTSDAGTESHPPAVTSLFAADSSSREMEPGADTRTEARESEDVGIDSPEARNTPDQQPVKGDVLAVSISQPALPLVLVQPDSGTHLSDSQLADLETLRAQFAEAVGGPNQDPSDPQYLERWKAARTEFDARVKAWLGSSVYIALERAASAESVRMTMQEN